MAMTESSLDSASLARDGLDSRSTTPHSFSEPVVYHRRPRPKYCMGLERFINSTIIQLLVILFAVLICLIATIELLLAYQCFKTDSPHTEEVLRKVFHYISFLLLLVFLIEVLIRICAMRVYYFQQSLEVFDGFVVLLAFTLDLSLWLAADHPAAYTATLIIILRLCRVRLIIKGITDKVKENAAAEVELERIGRQKAEATTAKLKRQCDQQSKEISFLKDLLRQHNIESLQMNGSVAVDNSIHTELLKLEAKKQGSSTTSPGTTNTSSPTFTERKSISSLDEVGQSEKFATVASHAILQSAMTDLANQMENEKNINILEKYSGLEKRGSTTSEMDTEKNPPGKKVRGVNEQKDSDSAISVENQIPVNPQVTQDSHLTDLDTLNLELAEIRRISEEALLQDFTTPMEGIDNPAIPTTSL